MAAALLCLAALSCGRETPATRPAATPVAAATPAASGLPDVASRQRRAPGSRAPVIWLGFDAFDFELVDRLAAEGQMPNWKRLEAEGYTAFLQSYQPILSPIVWTTLATGVGPDAHRVLDFQEVDPVSGQKVPISGNSRAVPAIWNVASASGLTVGVVGWWATHPAEEVKGFFITDHSSPILYEGLPRQGLTFPTALAAGVEQISAREGAVTTEELARFVDIPVDELARERSSQDGLPNELVLLVRAIGATRVQARIARELYDRNLPDLMMLYLEGTDVVAHLYASELPPQMNCVSDADFARYHRTAERYYSLVDQVIGQWMRRAQEDGATLIVNSDHGFKWGKDRSCQRGSFDPATAGWWHRIDGVFAAWGARVKPNTVRGRASVFDVEPTVAALLDLPVDRHVKGAPIRAAFPDLPSPPRKDLAAAIPVQRLAAERMSEKEASEYAKKLMALGYLSGSEPGKLAPSGGDRPGLTELGWQNLGLYFLNLGGASNLASAEAAFNESLRLRANSATPRFNLALLHRIRGQDRLAIDGLFQAIAAGQPSPEREVLDWALFYNLKGKSAEEREILERGAAKYPASEDIQRAAALMYYRTKDCRRGDAVLSHFEAATEDTQTLNALALIRACLGRKNDAIALFRRSLAIAPNQKGVIESLEVLQANSKAGGASAP
jgi:predicted AlkP superfamily phosphohydrolase/phosphomutase/tetratricopeptide (TPR) repeat protein